jgi:hypothetical protein
MAKTKNAEKLHTGSKNFISKLFFISSFVLIFAVRRARHVKDAHLGLGKQEHAALNDELLESKWKKELLQAKKQNRQADKRQNEPNI